MKAKSVLIAAVLALAASGAAHATKPGNNGGGNGGCGVGQQTNGCGGGTSSNTATGGAGGHGVGIGQGGNASATGGRGGDGGSVWGSGNSSNANSNKQDQSQGQISANRNDNRSSATGGSNSNSNANSGNNSAQSVTVQGDNYDSPRIPVATAYAPNIAPTAVCMGSSSAGAQGVTFGVSFGSSWTDDNCMLLEQVRTVSAVLGDRETAAEMMCEVKAYAAARERAGKPCGQSQQVATVAPQVMGDTFQPKYGPVAMAPIVSPVPPRIERYRVTLDGLQRQ